MKKPDCILSERAPPASDRPPLPRGGGRGAGTILVATDLSAHAARAELRAAMLAQSLGAAKLALLHVVPQLPLEALTHLLERTPLETEQRLIDAASDALTARAQRLSEQFGIARFAPAHAGEPPFPPPSGRGRGERSLSSQTIIRIGRPHIEIADMAETLDADLIVVGGYGADLVREWFLGATAEKVLSTSRRPVLVVKQEPRAPYQRVLAPTDFSPAAACALDWAQAIAGNASIITIAHVYEAPYESTLRYASVENEIVERYQLTTRQQAEDALNAFLASRRAAGPDFHQRLLHGHPAAGIRELTEEMQPDLIVMGKHGQTEIEELLLGSVTRHVLSETRCDMLVAHEPPETETSAS